MVVGLIQRKDESKYREGKQEYAMWPSRFKPIIYSFIQIPEFVFRF